MKVKRAYISYCSFNSSFNIVAQVTELNYSGVNLKYL